VAEGEVPCDAGAWAEVGLNNAQVKP